MKYRSEIDGLRAIAVLPVIFFHAGIEFLSGGYIGVDIFFVISGFLITTILLSEIAAGSFSLLDFYERRARRILPALFFVMLVSIPFAWMFLIPSDMKDFSESLIAVTTFSSNVLFWSESGYWGPNNELKPMLHTWSLAVEEQYYIVFPLFLLLLWKIRKNWIFSTILVVALFSLLLSHWGAQNKPTANFFMLPTRLWELAVGALIAYYLLNQDENEKINRSVNETLGLIGLLMIVYAIVFFDESTPFPSLYTLVPTMGTGLIILFASSKTWVGRLLSNQLLVGIGLISYSIYLWHQPLLAFARHGTLYQPSKILLFGLAVLSIPLAYLSWRFIEKPFRTKGVFERKTIFSFSAAASVAFILFGVVGVTTNGFENRSVESHLTLEAIDNRWRINAGLDLSCTETFTLSDKCNTSDKPEIMVWGDSYAMHLVKGIMASNPEAKIIQMTKYVCGPFLNISPIINPDYPVAWSKECHNFNQQVHEWLINNNSVKYAVLSSPFSQYLSEDAFILNNEGEQIAADAKTIIKEFEHTLDTLESLGVKPIVFSPPPANGSNLGRCLIQADWKGESLGACNFTKEKMTDIRNTVFNFLQSVSKKHAVVRLDDYMCEGNTCNTHIDSTYLFRDEGHLSHEGTELLGEKHNFYASITGEDSNEFVEATVVNKRDIVILDELQKVEPKAKDENISINTELLNNQGK